MAKLSDIDPALELMGRFAKVTGQTASQIQKMREQAIFANGAVSAKFKALAAAVWSISARCEPCIKYYVMQARNLGATEQELGEFLAVASTMGGCVGEMWALKAFKAFHDEAGAASACCPTEHQEPLTE